jgi:hypothetical protein
MDFGVMLLDGANYESLREPIMAGRLPRCVTPTPPRGTEPCPFIDALL